MLQLVSIWRCRPKGKICEDVRVKRVAVRVRDMIRELLNLKK